MLLGRIPGGGPLAQEPRGPVALVCGPRSHRARPVCMAQCARRPGRLHGHDVAAAQHHGEEAQVQPTVLEEKAAWRGMALTGDVSSVAMRAVAVEHDSPAATLAARAPATAEEEMVALGSGTESGGDLRGRRRRQRVGTGRGGRRWSAADAYPREWRWWRTASDHRR
jgi:hypothetical protein